MSEALRASGGEAHSDANPIHEMKLMSQEISSQPVWLGCLRTEPFWVNKIYQLIDGRLH
jgi:hypothetical protein